MRRELRNARVPNLLKVSDLKKFHHFYGHTHPDKLLKFLKNAWKYSEGLKSALAEIETLCESRVQTKPRKPRPRCSIPRTDGLDQMLSSIDLKEWKRKGGKPYICYLNDMFSRLTSGANKHPDTIGDSIGFLNLEYSKLYILILGVRYQILWWKTLQANSGLNSRLLHPIHLTKMELTRGTMQLLTWWLFGC